VEAARSELDEHFATGELDPEVWLPHYLPHWSSRAASAATWGIGPDGLVLRIPLEQPLWAPESHPEPLRVSCMQSGELDGQQPFLTLQQVTEHQPPFHGYLPRYGRIEVRMRMTLSPRSMAAFWMSGIEDKPRRSGEICVAEVFGDGIDGDTAEVGIGIKKFRDPALDADFETVRMRMDVAQFHTYAVDWRPGSLVFTIDDVEVRTLAQSPDYPCQLMIGVFDFPKKGRTTDTHEPELIVAHVRGTRHA
jgi:hypothetical protein